MFALVLITLYGGLYVGVIQSRSGKMIFKVNFMAAWLPLVCIPIVLSFACSIYKWWIFIIFLSCLYSSIYQIVFLLIVKLCVWPIELIVTFYLEDIFVLMIGRMLELSGRMMVATYKRSQIICCLWACFFARCNLYSYCHHQSMDGKCDAINFIFIVMYM